MKLVKLNDICNRMMDYCDRHSEDENGKISVAFSNCFLEKVTLKRREPDQLLVSGLISETRSQFNRFRTKRL